MKQQINKNILYFIENAPSKFLKAIIIIISQFVLTWYLANYGTKEFLGRYQLILSIIGVVTIFSLPGMKVAIIQSVANGYDYSLIGGTKYSFIQSLLGSFVTLLISVYYLFYNDTEIGKSLIISAFFFPFFFSFNNYIYYLVGKYWFKIEAVSSTGNNIILTAGLILAYRISNDNLLLFIFLYFGIQTSISICWYIYLCSKIRIKKIDHSLNKYAMDLTKINGIVQVTNQIDKVLIGLFLNPIDLAIFSIGIMATEKLKNIISPILTIFIPAFASNKIKISKQNILYLFLLSISLYLLTLILIPFFISFFFQQYQDSIRIGQSYSLVILFFPINIFFGYYYRALKKVKILQRIELISRFSMLIMQILFFILGGIKGIVYARILGQVINIVLNLKNYVRNN